jgi:hypothetical protein
MASPNMERAAVAANDGRPLVSVQLVGGTEQSENSVQTKARQGGRRRSRLTEHSIEPGYKTNGTDREAAEYQRPRAPIDRAIIRQLIEQAPGTPEELTRRYQAQRPGRRVLLTTVRSRVSELKLLGEIVHDGSYGIGDSGKCRVARFRKATAEEREAFLAKQEACHG